MSDDSDLLIAAAATAAVVTWMGTRSRRQRRRGVAGRTLWRARLRAVQAGVARSWRETPGYHLVTGIRDAFFRKR
jgi:hypothetical protein